jgi:hypothetical protein
VDGTDATATSDGDDPGPDGDGDPSGNAAVDLADLRRDLTVAAAAALGTVGVTALSATSTVRAGTVARLLPLAGYVGYRVVKGRGGPLSAASTWVTVSLVLGVGTVVALVVA